MDDIRKMVRADVERWQAAVERRDDLVKRLERIKLELQGTTAQGGDAECLLDSLLADLRPPQERG